MPKLSVAIIAAIAFSAGCQTNPQMKWSNARQITAGMTTAEVSALIGKPYSVAAISKTEQERVWVTVNVWDYSTKSLRVRFKDGKVTEPPPIPDEFKD